MTYKILILVVFCINTLVYSQNPVWLAQTKGPAFVIPRALVSDAAGNSYVAGAYTDTITVGSATHTSFTYNNGIVAKLDAAGNFIWSLTISSQHTMIYDMCADGYGNYLLTGIFQTATLSIGSVTLSSSGPNCVFLCKVSSAGAVIWAKKVVQGNGWVTGLKLSANYSRINLCGEFTTGLVIGTYSFAASGHLDTFLSQFDQQGSCMWAHAISGTANDYPTGITLLSTGEIVIVGYSKSNIVTMGGDTLINSPSNSPAIFFIAKFQSNGNLVWVKSGEGNAHTTSIAADNLGNFFIGGRIDSTLVIGTSTIASANTDDGFVVKLDSSGSVLWSHTVGGPSLDNIVDLATDLKGNVHLIGKFSSYTITVGTSTVSHAGGTGNNAVLLVYSPAGKLLSVNGSSGSGYEEPAAISVDVNGATYITGHSLGNQMIFGLPVVVSLNKQAIYVIKFAAPTTSTTPTTTTTTSGVNEDMMAMHVNFFPNPVQNILHIQASELIREIEIIDSNGRVVEKYCIPQVAEFTINLSELASGVYMLNVTGEKGRYAKKIVMDDRGRH